MAIHIHLHKTRDADYDWYANGFKAGSNGMDDRPPESREEKEKFYKGYNAGLIQLQKKQLAKLSSESLTTQKQTGPKLKRGEVFIVAKRKWVELPYKP